MSHLQFAPETMRWLGMRILRSCAFAALFALMIPATGCNREEEKRREELAAKYAEEEAEAAASRRPLELDESVVVEFAADGRWHPLPYSVFEGQAFRIEAFGATRNFGTNLIEFQVMGRTMLVTDGHPFVISTSGAVALRVRLLPGMAMGPSAQVQITRLK